MPLQSISLACVVGKRTVREMSILDEQKGMKLQNKTTEHVCIVFNSGAKGLGWPTKQCTSPQGGPLQLSEEDIGTEDKHNFKSNQEK